MAALYSEESARVRSAAARASRLQRKPCSSWRTRGVFTLGSAPAGVTAGEVKAPAKLSLSWHATHHDDSIETVPRPPNLRARVVLDVLAHSGSRHVAYGSHTSRNAIWWWCKSGKTARCARNDFLFFLLASSALTSSHRYPRVRMSVPVVHTHKV